MDINFEEKYYKKQIKTVLEQAGESGIKVKFFSIPVDSKYLDLNKISLPIIINELQKYAQNLKRLA